MSTMRTIARSFAGGVIAPEMFGRFDLRSYQTGLQQCDNFVVLPHGPVTKRPGFEYGLPIELGSVTRARLIPFATNEDSILIALTETHAYFLRENKPICLTSGAFTAVGSTVTKNTHGYSNGDVVFLGTFSAGYPDVGTYFEVSSVATDTFTATALVGGATVPASGSCGKVYRIAAATATNLLKIARYSQSGQTLTLTTGSTAPVELTRTSDSSWTVATPTFETLSAQLPDIPPHQYTTGNTSIAGGGTCGPHNYVGHTTPLSANEQHRVRYRVTCFADSGEESLPSSPFYNQPLYAYQIQSVTAASPAVFTTALDHGLITGDRITLDDLAGSASWVALNDKVYKVIAYSATTFSLALAETGVTVNSTGYGAHTANSGTFFMDGYRVDLGSADNRVYVAFAAVAGYQRYGIYKQDMATSLFGYVGTLDVETAERFTNGSIYFIDDNITPDVTRTPPEDWNPFSGSGNYPLAVAHNEQRRIFGGTENDPQRVFMSPIGFEWSMAQHFPVLDSDAFDFTVASRVHHRVQHLVAVGDMLALTKNCEFQIKSGDGSAIGPASVNARAQSYIGANDVQPAVAESSVVFISASGERPHEITYARDGSGGYVAVDIGVFTPHYFSGYTIVDLAYLRGEVPSLWAVRSDGTLLSCTYLPGEEVRAWHRHTTNGVVQSVAAVFEDYKDRLYIAVIRDVDGTDVLMIERMAPWTFDEIADAQFRDSFHTRTGAASTSVTGLWHLEGETVTALGDGVVFSGLTVASGAITLPQACAKVTVGRAYTSDLMTLPVSVEIQGAAIGRPKNVPRAFLRLYKSSGVKVGPTFNDLYEYNEVAPDYGEPYALLSGTIEIPLSSTWSEDGAVCLRSDDPRPVCVQAMSFEVTVGG